MDCKFKIHTTAILLRIMRCQLSEMTINENDVHTDSQLVKCTCIFSLIVYFLTESTLMTYSFISISYTNDQLYHREISIFLTIDLIVSWQISGLLSLYKMHPNYENSGQTDSKIVNKKIAINNRNFHIVK